MVKIAKQFLPSLFLPPVRGACRSPSAARKRSVSRGRSVVLRNQTTPLVRSVSGGALDFGRTVLRLSIHLAFGETLEDRAKK